MGETAILPRADFAFHRPPRPILFIGYHKTATRALCLMLMASGVRAVYGSGNGPILARSEEERAEIPHVAGHIQSNLDRGVAPLSGLESYDAFLGLRAGATDLCHQFRTFYDAYPDALFILNTKPEDEWLSPGGALLRTIRASATAANKRPRRAVQRWRRQFRTHHENARAFFAETAPDQFLEWDIQTDPNVLTAFLDRFGIDVNPDYYFQLRETGPEVLPDELTSRPCLYYARILPTGHR